MSEHNFAALAFKDNLKKNPDLFGHIGPDGELSEKLEKQLADSAKARQVLDAKNAAMRNTSQEQRKEYNRLLNDHFNLKQWVKGCEIRVNESAGQIRNHEQRLTSLLNEKKATESPIGQRNIEHGIVRLEGELAEEQKKYERLRKENLQDVRQLKEFDVARLEALKAELDSPKIVAK